MPDIVVRRHSVHGMAVDQYASALRERLPDREVAVGHTPAAERDLVTDATVVTGTSIDEALLGQAESLRLFASTYAGYDHLPLGALADRGVALTTASGVHGPNVAEYVVGAWLSLARGFLQARRQQREGVWQAFQASDFAGSRVCVVGMGAIGEAIVARLDGFDVETVTVRHSPGKDAATDEVYGYEEIHEAVAGASYVALACPLTDETRGLVDESVLRSMHPDCVLVNVARGPVVDTDALVDACQHNYVGGAVLDVTDPEPLPGDHPLWDFENVLLTPHNAGHTPEYYERLADIVAENVRRAEETGSWDGLENQVDLDSND
ncbi:D-2-hydroxyacid dehydrogenase [Haloarcula salinisoli]|uniref:D-2-hydroxyacid dehydrogenase n=1 Tax=Haloarcula salinisoli TaxID=2487746 RepID=A0A8J8C814_9EURY|nr:D-2-hydroxyacid dehydrogenase [Halomicroarcula salinisoli]MBX0285838.1 D-2-hydroxyacid dehydrogenase [Halomicroarcula salinisoli]MBX0302669.1 D-2-hydroxyacid dehydrogenase [Halomicroarcula salinisoli]